LSHHVIADLEWWLVKKGVITSSELEEDPRETEEGETRKTVFKIGSRAVRDDDDDLDEDER
jgi:hypothetical protein